MAVSVRGTVYVNAYEASAALGVALITVYTAVINGRTDQLGLGRGSHSKATFKDGLPGRNKPYDVMGRVFKSMAEASRFIGHHEDYIKRMTLRIGAEKTKALVEQKYLATVLKESATKEQKAWKDLNSRQSFGIERRHIGLTDRY